MSEMNRRDALQHLLAVPVGMVIAPEVVERAAAHVEAVGASNVSRSPMNTGAEDFSYFQRKAPGVFLFLGVSPRGADPRTIAANHSPYFFADESALPNGVRVMSSLAVDYLTGATTPRM